MAGEHDDTIVEDPRFLTRVPLIRKRGKIKAKLTSSEKILASIGELTDFAALDLEDRLEKHVKLWDEFIEIQNKLEEISVDEEDFKNLDLEQESFDNRYHSICGLFKKYIKNPVSAANSNAPLNTASSIVTVTESPSNQSTANSVTNEPTATRPNNFVDEHSAMTFNARFELPRLQAPTFHGNLDTWLTFHDSFRSMCHDNPSLSTIQKFHYLKASLKDEAAEVIAALEITQDNYQVAWELLNSRYDNRKYITESHVQALLDLPSISKDFTVRNLLDNVQKRIRVLQALNQPVNQWDVFLILVIRQKLNNYLREKWEETVGTTELPTFKKLLSFLERRSLTENTQSFQRTKETQKPFSKQNGNQSKGFPKNTQTCLTANTDAQPEKPQPSCPACKGSHYLGNCDKFKELTPQERYDLVKKSSICHNCFGSNHRTLDCRKFRCRKCRRRHHILLHFDSEQSSDNNQTKQEMTCQNVTALLNCKSPPRSQVILATAIVDILDSKGNYRPCRAFLDSCSQCNSVTEKFAKSLGLDKKEVKIKLKGVENLESNIKYVTNTEIKSRYEDLKLNLSIFVFKKISDSMPTLPIDRNAVRIPETIFLADPNFHRPADIDILIGAEHFYSLLRAGQRPKSFAPRNRVRVDFCRTICKSTTRTMLVAI